MRRQWLNDGSDGLKIDQGRGRKLLRLEISGLFRP